MPDPVVDRTIAKLRKAKPSEKGIVTTDLAGLIRCEIAAVSIDRLGVILPRIIAAAKLQGFRLVAGEKGVPFESATESISFSIAEAIRREKHVLTDAERAKEEAWQRKRDRAALRRSWDAVFFDRPQFPEWDYHATGLLSFEFEHVYVLSGASPRRTFRDTNTQCLENMASEISVGLAVIAAAKTEERLRSEEEERKREEARRRREMAARAKHIEERRSAGLGAILAEIYELDRLRRLLASLEKDVSAQPTPRLSTFLAWAREHLAQREARLSAETLESRFDAEHLFGNDDDHRFTPPAWY